MTKQQKSLIVWVLVFITVVSACLSFVLSLPDFANSETEFPVEETYVNASITTTLEEAPNAESTQTTTTSTTVSTTITTIKRTRKTTLYTTTLRTTAKTTTKKTTTRKTELQVQFPLNINTASKEELMCIPGIGDVYSTRILEYREQNNGFKSLEELLLIKGIGEKRLQAFSEYLVCE